MTALFLPMTETSRRQFLQTTGAAMIGSALSPAASAPLKISVFSKHLQFLDWAAMAEAAAEMGFDGVDLTLRKGGHVLPERAETDLPKVAAIIRQAGLALPTITAGITDTDTPQAESMLRAISGVGITHYRWGGFEYVDHKPIPDQLPDFTRRAARLAELNRKYNLCAMYHTHSGMEVGSSIWDLWVILKDLDHTRVGVNLDISHATIEGGLGAWIKNVRLITPLMRGVALKDFRWGRNDKGEWRPQWCPLGEGMVNFKLFFAMLKEANFSGPAQLHFEYPLGGAEHGSRNPTMEKAKILAAMKRDLTTLRGWLREAQLA
jgi:sugar phosphate isomerase/epimerase